MISKKCFVKIIEASQEYYDKVDVLFDLLNIQPENFILHYLDSILDALSNEIEDISEDDPSWLEPIVFDYAFNHNWGRSYSDSIDYIIKINDKKYRPETAEELYDCLIDAYYGNNNDKIDK